MNITTYCVETVSTDGGHFSKFRLILWLRAATVPGFIGHSPFCQNISKTLSGDELSRPKTKIGD
jgi:hypothetical protein